MSSDYPNYQHKRILVLGLGMSGRSAAKFLLKRGALVTGADRNINNEDEDWNALKKQGLKTVSDTDPCNIKQFDLMVVSPGISVVHPLYMQALASGTEIIGEIELACRSIKQKCLAITGTNGKTTVTLMVNHALNHADIPARALGNVGMPLASAVEHFNSNHNEILVIELSSFQLDTLHTRFIDAGVILNITPDHLDRYDSLASYAASKVHLYECLKPQGKLFAEDKCTKEFPSLFSKCHLQTYGYHKNCFIYTDNKSIFADGQKAFDLPMDLQGKKNHDVENIMAAFSLCRYAGMTARAFQTAMQSFQKPRHRIEFIRTVRGVHYYDDSKGTNIDAVIRAVETLEGRIILIAGGVDKGASYTLWLNSMANKIKFICAIGNAKEKIKSELEGHIPVALFATLDDAVAHAASISEGGDTVLLSPGCSSFDMFKDYAHRGEEFQRIVNKL